VDEDARFRPTGLLLNSELISLSALLMAEVQSAKVRGETVRSSTIRKIVEELAAREILTEAEMRELLE
jgi:hypothetical protein